MWCPNGNVDNFGYLVVASELHAATTVDRVTAGVRADMDAIGGTRVTSPEETPDAPLVILVATGGTEVAILDHARRRSDVVPFEPIVLVAHPLHNSLPAALEAMARARADGRSGRIVQAEAGAPDAIATAVADVTAIHRLHRTRLGAVGEPSPWLVASIPDADSLRARWGVELVPIGIADTIEAHRSADPERTRTAAERFSGTARPSAELMRAAALHPVLVDAIAAARVDAVAVRCFDYLGALRTSGCIALAQLNDSGIVAGCEGDIASTVAMLLVRALLDQPSWMANPAAIDEANDRVLLAHCTVAPSLVSDIELHTHFESGLGIGLRGTFSPGPVTLMRLGGRSLDQLWISDGDIEHAGQADDLCRTQVTVRLVGTGARTLLEEPLGNHLLMFHGHRRDRVERWWRLAFGSSS